MACVTCPHRLVDVIRDHKSTPGRSEPLTAEPVDAAPEVDKMSTGEGCHAPFPSAESKGIVEEHGEEETINGETGLPDPFPSTDGKKFEQEASEEEKMYDHIGQIDTIMELSEQITDLEADIAPHIADDEALKKSVHYISKQLADEKDKLETVLDWALQERLAANINIFIKGIAWQVDRLRRQLTAVEEDRECSDLEYSDEEYSESPHSASGLGEAVEEWLDKLGDALKIQAASTEAVLRELHELKCHCVSLRRSGWSTPENDGDAGDEYSDFWSVDGDFDESPLALCDPFWDDAAPEAVVDGQGLGEVESEAVTVDKMVAERFVSLMGDC